MQVISRHAMSCRRKPVANIQDQIVYLLNGPGKGVVKAPGVHIINWHANVHAIPSHAPYFVAEIGAPKLSVPSLRQNFLQT